MTRRLAVAGTCRALRDFVYRHSELWPNITASGALGNGISGPLNWAAERRHVRRLRVTLSGLPTTQNCEETVKSLARAVHNLQELVSLQVTMDVGLVPMDPMETIFPASGAPLKLPRTLKQLTLAAPSLHLPSSMSELTALTALSLRSVDSSRMGDGVTFAPDSLPRGLLILEIGSLGQTHLPEALKSVEALQSLTVDWAWEGTDAAVAPELSLLEESSSGDTGRRSWCDHLTHLGLGYFEAKALPKALPPSLKSLDLQWNLTTTESCCRKASVDVDTFHASFSCLQPLTALKHLCLNNALGGWGLPDAVTRLTQLESLGVAGTSPLWHWEGRRADIAPQLSANFPNLKSLDIEIYEAAAGWEHIAKCSKLERLRLGKSAAAEAYVRSDVRAVVGRGLVRLLPALPALKEVHTEGMLLPATSACRRWERLLLGFEADSVRAEAAAAVDGLYRCCVALYRWYSWPFWPGTANHSDKFCPWDEVPIN